MIVSTTGDDNDDYAHQNDLDQWSATFLCLRPASAAVPRGLPTDANVCPGAGIGSGSGSDQRLRLGWPTFQRWVRVLCSRQSHADLQSRKVGTRRSFRRLSRRFSRHKMNLGTMNLATTDGPPHLAASFMTALTTGHAAHGLPRPPDDLRGYRRSPRRPTPTKAVRF